MKEIFLTSSALILIISILRHFLHGKIAPRLQYALWLLVAARLLIPGSLFTVPVSIIGAADGLPETVQAVFPEPLPQNSTAVPDSGTVSVQPDAVPQLDASPSRNWPDIVWKTGIAVTGGAMLLSNLWFAASLRRKRRKITLPPSEETGGLPVYLAEDLASPCLFGLFQPCIYINPQALDPVRLPYILAHERTHFRHGDHLWVVLRAVCLTLHWYNPLVWLAAALCRRDCELACDDGVIWMLGENRRLEYGGVLLKMVSAGSPSLLRASTSMSAGKRILAERITMIAQRPRMLKMTTAAVALVMCAAVTLTFGGAEKISPDALLGKPDSLPSDAQPNAGQLLSTEYTHFSGLFSLTLPENWLEDVVYVEDEDGVAFYEAESSFWLMSVVPEPVEWVEIYNPTGIRLNQFVFNGNEMTGGSPYFYILDWNQEPEDSGENLSQILALLDQRDELADGFRFLAAADTFSQLVHNSYENNLSLAIAYLPYLSWSNYKALYGWDDMFSALNALWEYTNSRELDWGQYHNIMSNRTERDFDGAASELYAGIIWNLYQNNPETFVSVLNSVFLTDGERANMLNWSRNALMDFQERYDLLDASDQEIHDILMAGLPSYN